MGVCRLANYKYFYCLNDSSTYAAGGGSLKFQLFPYQVRRLSGLPRIRVLVCALWSFGEPRAVHTQPCLLRFVLGPAAVLHADTGGGGQNTTIAAPLALRLWLAPIGETRGFNLWPSGHETHTFAAFCWNLSFWKVLLSLSAKMYTALGVRGQVEFSSVTQWRCFRENADVS